MFCILAHADRWPGRGEQTRRSTAGLEHSTRMTGRHVTQFAPIQVEEAVEKSEELTGDDVHLKSPIELTCELAGGCRTRRVFVSIRLSHQERSCSERREHAAQSRRQKCG